MLNSRVRSREFRSRAQNLPNRPECNRDLFGISGLMQLLTSCTPTITNKCVLPVLLMRAASIAAGHEVMRVVGELGVLHFTCTDM